tara:strand:- start:678 stop:1988 length:1311 start_codon:yes stop_codon:yes gene_type:complete
VSNFNIYNFVKDLYPICRSITGDGTYDTLKKIKKFIPLELKKIKSGEKVFDWTVPKEWNVKDAFIADEDGNKIIDFKKNNLHLVSYSEPIDRNVSYEELIKHLHYLKDNPDWIPYRTSYYNKDWGFCLSYNQFKKLKKTSYHVKIDTSLSDGYLRYGELYVKGKSEKEILFSTYTCHPSMCNDNLSGVSVLTKLAKSIGKMDLNYSYRFLFIPETIGSISWLAKNENKLEKIIGGMVVTCCGDRGKLNYKKSRIGNGLVDYFMSFTDINCKEFAPMGSDERQFCSQGINLPIGCLTRTAYGEYDEYHTSADDLNFVQENYLNHTYIFLKNFISDMDSKSEHFFNLSEKKFKVQKKYTKAEVNLGEKGLYTNIGGVAGLKGKNNHVKAIKWLMNYSDGDYNLGNISMMSKTNLEYLNDVALNLTERGLLKKLGESND